MDQQQKWDLRFLEKAKQYAEWSKDPSTQVGAVIVDEERKDVVGVGYNGFPRGVLDLKERYDDRETKYKLVVHAEVNACIDAGKEARGRTIYVWPQFTTGAAPTCHDCAKVIIQSGIIRVVGQRGPGIRGDDWGDSVRLADLMYREAGVMVDLI